MHGPTAALGNDESAADDAPTTHVPLVIGGGVEVRGFEPLASSVRGRRSAGLSYTPR